MPGLRIAHRLVDFGFNEPTRIYDVVENDEGRLELQIIFEQRGYSIEDVAQFLNSRDVRRPVVLQDFHPQVAHYLKQSGIRVR